MDEMNSESQTSRPVEEILASTGTGQGEVDIRAVMGINSEITVELLLDIRTLLQTWYNEWRALQPP